MLIVGRKRSSAVNALLSVEVSLAVGAEFGLVCVGLWWGSGA